MKTSLVRGVPAHYTDPMRLTERQRTAFRQICDTFAPGDGAGVPSASTAGAPELSLEIAAANPREVELRQLRLLLAAWDTRAAGLMLHGSPRRFSARTAADREQALLRMADSPFGQVRALFQALKGAAILPYYLTAGAPLLDTLGHPGPLGPLPDAPAPALTVLRPDRDRTLDCDVVVVGSGAGGGTAAGVLTGAGLDVVVLEAGDYKDDADFDGSERTGFTQLYALAPQASAEGQILLIAGRTLGGGTVVNYTTAFRTRDGVREEWASHGLPQFTGAEYDEALDAVCARLHVNRDHDLAAPRDAVLERGLTSLGWHVDAMPRNVRGCDMGTDCGRCGSGCRIGAKQSTVKTWLADAAGRGARLVVGTTARRVTVAAGRATGVEAVTADGHRLTVRARAVVVAAGAIQTPALLRRSGLANPTIGRHLRLHPATVVWGRMAEPVLPWTGSMQSRYSDEHIDLDGDGYGVLYETGPANPALGTGFVPWHGGRAHLARMQELAHLVPLAVIVRDKDGGEVRIGRDGEPVVHYRLSPRDSQHLQRGLEGGARILEAAGADRIYSPHQAGIDYEPGQRGSLATFTDACRRAGTEPGRLALASLHIMGSARMGGSSETSAVDPDGVSWEVDGLVVADASCFPTASGTNPMVSIEAIAWMNARRLAARLT